MASLTDALKLYLKLGILGTASGYGYLHYRCGKLRDESQDFDVIQAKKDATRP